MSEKRTASIDEKCVKKVRKSITLELKLDILRRFDAGEKNNEIAKILGLATSTVGTIKDNRHKILSSVQRVTPLTAKNISRQRSEIMEEMERLLSVWIDHQTTRNVPLSTIVIQEKAKHLHADLVAKHGESSRAELFLASKGWFDRFKKRHSLHNIKTVGEAASADVEGARKYPEEFLKIIQAGEYTSQQVYNVDETGLFWKRMPSRTFISKDEKSASGFKAAKDRITLLVGGNAAGDNKLKPLLIYHSENPRAFKNINKSQLGVTWRSNKKGWMTSRIFEDWLNNDFSNAVTKFNADQNISNKALLIVDNAPSHKLNIVPNNIKVVFLPPNTTPLLQPMDQGVIANFKAYYLRRVFKNLIESIDGPNQASIKDFWKQFNIKDAVNNIIKSWAEVKQATMNGVWIKLWPECTDKFQSSRPLQDVTLDIENEIVSIAHEAGMCEVDTADVTELLECADEDISNEELLMLVEETGDAGQTEHFTEHENSSILTVNKMSKAFSLIEEAMEIFSENDPSTERSLKVSRQIENALLCYKELYRETKKPAKQTSLDSYFSKTTEASFVEVSAHANYDDSSDERSTSTEDVNENENALLSSKDLNRKSKKPVKQTSLDCYFSKTTEASLAEESSDTIYSDSSDEIWTSSDNL